MNRSHAPWLLALATAASLVLGGCQAEKPVSPYLVAQGQFGEARMETRARMTNDKSDRQYLLDRMKLGVLTLDDGYASSAQGVFEDTYQLLRTQGINADKTVASVVINEDVKFWKGEPFEQALAMAYYGLQQGEVGSWDNVRAAAQSSLFQLRDFGNDSSGHRMTEDEIARRAAQSDQSHSGDYLNSGYAVRRSNFVLGYLLNAVANEQLGRAQEAHDNLAVALEINPELHDLADELSSGKYNTILVVAYGLGPRKEAYGPDGALARFGPRTRSDGGRLSVGVAGGGERTYPLVTDVNVMAFDHMWNNLEDVRIAKSVIGNVLLQGGAVTTGYGVGSRNGTATAVGLGLMAAGVFAKAGAHADTRYCDAFPQRFYLVPLNITEPGGVIDLQVEGSPHSLLRLTGLMPPAGSGQGTAQLRYVRLLTPIPGDYGSPPPPWATSGQVLYGNDVAGPAPGTPFPYILGGNDVRVPSPSVMASYQSAGQLTNMTLAGLEQLYRAEGITTTPEDTRGYALRHVLEGGRSLVPPLGGTTGFVRVFGQIHPPYRPTSDVARADAAPSSRTGSP